MLCARLRIQGPAAKFAVPAMGPETGRELPRTETVMTDDRDGVLIEVRAADSSAMRAALNSHLECIRIIEDIEDLTEMKP